MPRRVSPHRTTDNPDLSNSIVRETGGQDCLTGGLTQTQPSVAQLEVQGVSTPEVAGSSPAGRANSTGGGSPPAIATDSPAGAPVEAGQGDGTSAPLDAPSPGTGAPQTRQQYQPALSRGCVSWRTFNMPVMAERVAGSGFDMSRANHRKQGEGCQSAIHSGVV